MTHSRIISRKSSRLHEKISDRTCSVLGLGDEEDGTERTTTKFEGQWNSTVSVIEPRIQRKRTSSFPSIRCVGSMSFENAKWNVFDALQRWHDECRSFISHKKFSKQAQCSRSSRGLVWWVDSADFWSVMFNHWEFNCARTVGSQIGSRRSEYFD